MLNKSSLQPKAGFYLSLCATVLTFLVIVIGAYTRLADAGLSCPDWPRCYGRMLVPFEAEEIAAAQSLYPMQLLETNKAAIEMLHRYLAGTLGLLIFSLFIFACRRMQSYKELALPGFLVALLIMQALLGMWTVTLKLSPLIVLMHLMGGLATFGGLTRYTLQLSNISAVPSITKKSLPLLASMTLLVLVVQLILGGWTSANYAALACLDFPLCHNSLIPELNWKGAFGIFPEGIHFNQYLSLDDASRVTIQVMHRLGALITTFFTVLLSIKLFQARLSKFLYFLSKILFCLLILQLVLGITNVLAGLPLFIAVLHNAIAALLLATVVCIHYLLYQRPKNATIT